MTSVLCVDTDQKKHMALIGLAVAGRPIGPLGAEDRSVGGVRNRTGP
jgi:hypothetical protein